METITQKDAIRVSLPQDAGGMIAGELIAKEALCRIFAILGDADIAADPGRIDIAY